jgi:hypothetical protein
VSSYCDCTCHEFIGSPLFDIYVGPYNNEPPPIPPIESRDKSNLNSTDDSSTMTHQNETKTEGAPQQVQTTDNYYTPSSVYSVVKSSIENLVEKRGSPSKSN